ncbi:hypothetical protein Tco_0049592, partial [Tanacetum coccineum]
MLENQEYNRSKGYHAVPPPYIWNFIPCKPDLTFINEIVKSENMNVTTVITPSDFEKDVSSHEPAGVKNIGDVVEPKTVRENNFIPPIIEDWNSDDKSEIDYTVRPSIEKIGFVKPPRETVEKCETTQEGTGKINTAGANVNTAGASINTVNRPINIAASTPLVNHPRPKLNAFKRVYSQSSRPFNRYYANKNNINVNTTRVKNTRAIVSENKGKGANAVKASACWGNPQQKEYKEKAVIDSGCS